MEGQDLIVSCMVMGNPPPGVTWTKNGEEELNVTVNPRLSVSSANNNHNLTIMAIHRSDAGNYRCVAVNGIGCASSFASTLTVYCEYIPCTYIYILNGDHVLSRHQPQSQTFLPTFTVK